MADDEKLFTWGSGNGGGAIDVVIGANGRAFGWLCEESEGSDYGPRIECFKWWIDSGPSGEDSDYSRARAAFGKAAAEHMRKKRAAAAPLSDGGGKS